MIDLDEALRERGTRWAETDLPSPDLHAAIERIPQRNKQIRTYLAVAATIVAVAVASTIWLIRPASHPPTAVPPARGGPSGEATSTFVLTAGPDSVLSRLKAIALSAAADNQDSQPTSIEAVKTTRAAANELGGSGIGNLPDVPVWLLQEHGNFVCVTCSTPPGGPAPTGSALTLVVDASSYTGLDFGLDDHLLDLSQLGTVIDLSDSHAIPPQLRAAVLALKGLDHAELVLTTWPRLHKPISADLGLGADAIWYVQAYGTFAEPVVGGPLPEDGQSVAPPPANPTAATMELVYPVDGAGVVAGKAKLTRFGEQLPHISGLGTVLTLRP